VCLLVCMVFLQDESVCSCSEHSEPSTSLWRQEPTAVRLALTHPNRPQEAPMLIIAYPDISVVSLYRVQGSIFPFKMWAWTRIVRFVRESAEHPSQLILVTPF